LIDCKRILRLDGYFSFDKQLARQPGLQKWKGDARAVFLPLLIALIASTLNSIFGILEASLLYARACSGLILILRLPRFHLFPLFFFLPKSKNPKPRPKMIMLNATQSK